MFLACRMLWPLLSCSCCGAPLSPDHLGSKLRGGGGRWLPREDGVSSEVHHVLPVSQREVAGTRASSGLDRHATDVGLGHSSRSSPWGQG